MTADTPGLRLPSIFVALALSTAAAQAQTLPWPTDPPGAGGPAPTAAPAPMMGAPMASPRPMPGPANATQQECMTKFTELRANVEKLRGVVDKVAGSAKSKSGPKATREDVCKAITNYAVAEGKWAKFIVDNTARCGMPPDLGKQITVGHGKTETIRKNVCSAGPAGGAPAAPSLSDALGTSRQPVASDTTTPRGTFDTLTGSAIAR